MVRKRAILIFPRDKMAEMIPIIGQIERMGCVVNFTTFPSFRKDRPSISITLPAEDQKEFLPLLSELMDAGWDLETWFE